MTFIDRVNAIKTTNINNNVANILSQPNLLTKIKNNVKLTLDEYTNQTIDEIKHKHVNTILYKINEVVSNILFKQVRLNEMFEIVNILYLKTSDGMIPLYGSSQTDKPVKLVNEYSYICNDEQLVRINKNCSVGYCFCCNGRFVLISDVMLTR